MKFNEVYIIHFKKNKISYEMRRDTQLGQPPESDNEFTEREKEENGKSYKLKNKHWIIKLFNRKRTAVKAPVNSYAKVPLIATDENFIEKPLHRVVRSDSRSDEKRWQNDSAGCVFSFLDLKNKLLLHNNLHLK